MKTTFTMAATLSLAAASVLAAGASHAAPLELHVKRSVTIAAPASQVWDAVKDFGSLQSWHPAVATDEIVSGKDDAVGAVRLLTLKGGGNIKEKLLEFDATGRRFRYTILEGVLPVSHYSSTLVVTSVANDKTLVTWTGRFKRKNPSDTPPDAESDKAATDAISGVYQSGLDNLKKIVAAK